MKSQENLEQLAVYFSVKKKIIPCYSTQSVNVWTSLPKSRYILNPKFSKTLKLLLTRRHIDENLSFENKTVKLRRKQR